MATSIEDRLNEIIEKRDEEIAALKEKLHTIEYRDSWGWRHLRPLTEEENMGLPLPRLEIRWRQLDRYNKVADYGLVYRHMVGHIEFSPISSTKWSGSMPSQTDLPYRDGAHIWHDMEHMKLPGFVTNTETGAKAKVTGHGEREAIL